MIPVPRATDVKKWCAKLYVGNVVSMYAIDTAIAYGLIRGVEWRESRLAQRDRRDRRQRLLLRGWRGRRQPQYHSQRPDIAQIPALSTPVWPLRSRSELPLRR